MKWIGIAPDLEVCARASTTLQALAALSVRVPDIAIVNTSLGATEVFDLVRGVRRSHRRLPLLLLAAEDAADQSGEALRSGANGFMNEPNDAGELRTSIRRVLRGVPNFPDMLADGLLDRTSWRPPAGGPPALSSLGPEQRAIMKLLAWAKTDDQISQNLGCRPHDLWLKLLDIRDTLGLRTVEELKQYALSKFH